MKKVLVMVAVLVMVLQFAILTPAAYAAPPASGGGDYHVVQRGETLFSIGRHYGVNPYYIAQVNGLPNPDCIYAGQTLYIPDGAGDGQGLRQWPGQSSGSFRPSMGTGQAEFLAVVDRGGPTRGGATMEMIARNNAPLPARTIVPPIDMGRSGPSGAVYGYSFGSQPANYGYGYPNYDYSYPNYGYRHPGYGYRCCCCW